MPDFIIEQSLTNDAFLLKHARAGRIGLVGGSTLIDKAINRAERHANDDHTWSHWSHAFVFQGQRHDGHHWVIESDLQINRRHIRLGAQENRISKYYDQKLYPTLAVLDFNLSDPNIALLLSEALEMVAGKARYSMRELLGTLAALKHDRRDEVNRQARDNSFYCSAFVRHLFNAAGIDLAPGIDVKHTTPEDIARTLVPHTAYMLQGTIAPAPIAKLAARINQRRQALKLQIRRK